MSDQPVFRLTQSASRATSLASCVDERPGGDPEEEREERKEQEREREPGRDGEDDVERAFSREARSRPSASACARPR